MKLDIVAFDHDASTHGGAEISNFEILSGLMARGHSLTLCYESAGDLLGEYQDRGACTIQRRTSQLQWKDRRAARMLFHFGWDVVRLTRMARSLDRPIIYCNVFKTAPLAALCARLTGCPLVVHVRTSLTTQLSRQLKAAMGSADKIIANSDHSARAVQKHLPAADVIRVYNGINLDSFALRHRSERTGRLRILYLGRVVREKGLHVLLDAMECLADRAKGMDVSICGSCPSNAAAYMAELEEKARHSSAHVEFLGHRTDTPDIMHDHDLLVLPSIWEEAFGRVIVEAMASGKPVIASDIGGIPEVLGPEFAPFLFQPGQASDLAAKIAQVQRLYEEGTVPTQRLRARAEEFSLDAAVSRVEAVLIGACENRAPGVRR